MSDPSLVFLDVDHTQIKLGVNPDHRQSSQLLKLNYAFEA
jgi:hypothetical protein